MTEAEREELQRWWLKGYMDEEIATIALSLGVRGARPKIVAANRARLLPPAGVSRPNARPSPRYGAELTRGG